MQARLFTDKAKITLFTMLHVHIEEERNILNVVISSTSDSDQIHQNFVAVLLNSITFNCHIAALFEQVSYTQHDLDYPTTIALRHVGQSPETL